MQGATPPPPPTTDNFRRTKLTPTNYIYYWKGTLMASRIHFKYWKNILISRLYEQFSRNDSTMDPEKISNFKNMNVLYIALKHVIWRFRICNYFCEISKFCDFMNILRNSGNLLLLIFPRKIYINGIKYLVCIPPEENIFRKKYLGNRLSKSHIL